MTTTRRDRHVVTPAQTLAVARGAGLEEEGLSLSGLAVLTFSRSTMERLEELCALEDLTWVSSSLHPYAAAEVVKRGTYKGLEVTALVPAMGASPLACVVEDLVACGVRMVLLLCAAWSLGEPLGWGDLVVPAYSVGPDGTSVHYGNSTGHVSADPVVVATLLAAGRERGATVHVGGNATCEALYRITPAMVQTFRGQGCLCMENGEASTLFAMARALGFGAGVLFQPYIDLAQGWDPALLDERFRTTARLQAEIALEAGLRLLRPE
jgi:uridine phosphorylase